MLQEVEAAKGHQRRIEQELDLSSKEAAVKEANYKQQANEMIQKIRDMERNNQQLEIDLAKTQEHLRLIVDDGKKEYICRSLVYKNNGADDIVIVPMF